LNSGLVAFSIGPYCHPPGERYTVGEESYTTRGFSLACRTRNANIRNKVNSGRLLT
jgi:hypothetical protein